MKKLVSSLCLLVLIGVSLHAQSKLTYSLQINSSGSIDPVDDVCVMEVSGGSCLGLEPEWNLNFMALVNYQLRDRLRLQTGAGFNVYNLEDINDALGSDVFSAKYLSIPIRAHYLMSKGKLRPYIGLSIRSDIRVNRAADQRQNVFVQDNASGFGMSMEALLGFEFDLKPGLTFQVEPTFSQGLIAYDQEVQPVLTGGPGLLTVAPIGMFADSLPTRIGFTFGLLFHPDQLFSK